jgi:hypothetical protein
MWVASSREYFREVLNDALRKTSVRLTETAQVYLVNLLCEFVRSENVYAGTDPGERPVLVDLLQRAVEADPAEAVRIYKHMGDQSLYFTGFFTEAVDNAEYWMSMGGTAYANVAGLMRPTAAASSALFAELSDRFRALVDLLTAMSLGHAVDDARIVGLVERYERTGDTRVRDLLRQHGVIDDPEIN